MLKKVSSYRTELMGFATLWIVLYHYRDYVPNYMNYISVVGYGGVDIFFFLSGFGLTYGWLKNEVKSISQTKKITLFYIRRIVRTLPTQFILTYLWARCNHMLIAKSLMVATGIGWFYNKIPYWDWFMPSMFIFYLFFPLWMWLNKKITQGKSSTNQIIPYLLCVLLSLFVTCIVILTDKSGMNMLVLTRIPIFFIGSWFGNCLFFGREFHKSFYITSIAIAILGVCLFVPYIFTADHKTLWNDGFYWHPFILITPGLLFFIAYIFDKVPCCIRSFFKFFGKISFEFYLLHCLYFEIIVHYFPNSFENYPNLSFVCLIINVGLASWAFLFCINAILAKIQKKSLQDSGHKIFSK